MTETEDVLSDKRQNEMNEVVNYLKKFEPTKVALEVLPKYEEKVNQNYNSYQKGDFSLSSNEIHQIGYRLAKECNLDKIYAVDWNDNLDDVPDIGQLAENNQSDAYDEALKIGHEIISQAKEYYLHHSIKEYLLWYNEKENITKGQEFYMKLALVGSESNPIGAIWTAKYWYYRNLLIYKNLVNLISSKEERIFVLYGAGHLYLLLQFLKDSGLFNVEVASDYLK
ncbi:hypothetical protein E0485_10780 [Paenibacillus albiflavus]|uniref:Uncharacterized protein n=1 Tax=Paenibacillus albiflavus TaxID=2545760 RepID=A0A4R4EH25_9BACL|nr:DUF5694 domain-containing protein [Paenibacillus albiflavus]TCZ77468.1 hypothetical protein E0485_10780 [Paenibacillus albiflavus]